MLAEFIDNLSQTIILETFLSFVGFVGACLQDVAAGPRVSHGYLDAGERVCENEWRVLAAYPQEFKANYPLVALRAIENLRIV
jgi:hypothetical protein